jgi:hypothetical protein
MFAAGIGNLARHAVCAFVTPLAKLSTCLLNSTLPAPAPARALSAPLSAFDSQRSLLLSSKTEPPCFLILAHSFAKIPGVGWGHHTSPLIPALSNPFRITSLCNPIGEAPWNHMLAKNIGGRGWVERKSTASGAFAVKKISRGGRRGRRPARHCRPCRRCGDNRN